VSREALQQEEQFRVNSNIGTQSLMEFTYLTVIKGIPDFSTLPTVASAFPGEISR
jgi:hypothetical protein